MDFEVFLFRCTARGGKAGQKGAAEATLQSRLLPIGLWLQRRVLWLCGLVGDDLACNDFFNSPFYKEHLEILETQENNTTEENITATVEDEDDIYGIYNDVINGFNAFGDNGEI